MSSSTIQKHPYHLVDNSPWPLFAGISVLALTIGAVGYMHFYKNGFTLMCLGFLCILFVMFVWWRDIVREGTYEGRHTLKVQNGIRICVILFILSEVMFFLAFFWAFFHSSLAPTIEIGQIWPPLGIAVFSPWGVPFLNTVILLSSGATVTWAHHAIVAGDKKQAVVSLASTVILAMIFTGFQALEYVEAPFTISDGVYGSTFYLATGFHGFHVIVGTLALAVCLFRLNFKDQFTAQHHVGFEATAWYWHFVDVVWLFLFVSIYWWGGR